MAGRLIAMWSGPRNISTALMRSFGNRPDTDVVDEPLYGHYLAVTGIDHPGREEILASMPTDWRDVVAGLTRAPADGRIFYQKHMTHHVTPDVGLDWIVPLDNCFLLRDPEEVVRSYRAKREGAAAADLGFEQQARIFDFVVTRTGRVPPVVDARDILENPRRTLSALCDALRIDFREEMLSWPAGRRDTDGVWARHWYDAVERSTGFAPYRPPEEPLDGTGRALANACRPFYEKLKAHGIGG
ncbi:MAG: HAD family hydrolase [bacterium]